MNTPLWQFESSTETDADRKFAWNFWTNPVNWRELEPGVGFELDGPFAPGTRGRTRMPGQGPIEWLIRTLDPGRSWTQEMLLPEASLMVSMLFEDVCEGRTRITQRLWLEGTGAEALVEAVRMFETTTPDGLKRIAAAIAKAQSNEA
jgi:hypothetical protein